MEKTIRKYALLNAVKHKGKANPGNVIGSVIQEDPSFKKDMKTNSKIVTQIVQEVNTIPLDQQEKELQENFPELLEKKEHEHNLFGFFNIPEETKVRTAFPPGPEKYPHLGHAKALLLNYELAKQYNGEFYLRFEDTNPTLVKEEFYTIMQENFKWLGIAWDTLLFASDYMDLFYKHAKTVLEKNQAYICSCDSETSRENRQKGKNCGCRDQPATFEEYMTKKEGEAVIRLKIDMQHQNTTMRDPAIMRIIEQPHARQGTKYRVWPTYDFQNSIMDGETKITHRLRSKEFELRNELQRYIQTLLGYTETTIHEFARFNLEGVESSGRIIREKIEKKELTGWDDPSLTTLVALKRRGFTPEGIKSFLLSTGITKHESTLTWDDLIMHNKRIVDASCNRYFFLKEPQGIIVKGAPKKEVNVKLHPEFPDRGTRTFNINEEFYIQKEDLDTIEDGEIVRLLDAINIIKKNNQYEFHSEAYEDFKGKGNKIIQWLPKSETYPTTIVYPNKESIKGLAEPAIAKLKTDTILQFNRVGFCRIDEQKEKTIVWYTHN